jgi:hypothetical protein
LGINTYRIYGSVARWEYQPDSGTVGSPTEAQIQANPNVINWSWWDTVMTTPPGGSDYSWDGDTTVWQGNARTIFQTLQQNGIRTVVVLRPVSPGGTPTWVDEPSQYNDRPECVVGTCVCACLLAQRAQQIRRGRLGDRE